MNVDRMYQTSIVGGDIKLADKYSEQGRNRRNNRGNNGADRRRRRSILEGRVTSLNPETKT